MGKFHISKNGELVPCRAKIKCRLGGPHFDTMEEGMEYLDTYNEKAVEQENSIKKDDDQVKQEVIKEVFKTQGAVDSEENGYEVKKKKLYTVELPNSDPDSGWHSVLCKNISGKIVVDFVHQTVYDRWKERKNVKLTEEEIKEQRKSYWKYAEEVKE